MNRDDLIACIEATRSVLDEEARALSTWDLAGIDACREKKLQLDRRLRELVDGGALRPGSPETAMARKLLADLGRKARANQARLEAAYTFVKGLRHAIVGSAEAQAYGPPGCRRSHGAPAPVLASAVE